MIRKFLLLDADENRVDVQAKLERLPGNGSAHFSVTATSGPTTGAAHDAILEATPPELKDDMRALIDVHLADEDGTPMHAKANAAYHLDQGDFPAAHRALGSVGDVSDLYRVYGEASTEATDRNGADLQRIHDVVAEQARIAREANERIAARKREFAQGGTTFSFTAQQEKTRDRAVAVACEALGLRKATYDDVVKAAANFGPHAARLTVSLRKARLSKAISDHADETCAPVWRERAAKAKEILSKPDFLVGGRPPRDRDPRTPEGFANAQGMKLSTVPTVAGAAGWAKKAYRCTLASPSGSFDVTINFGDPKAAPPQVPDVLRILQSDMSSAEIHDEDSFVEDMGYASGEGRGAVSKMKEGQAAYRACVDMRDRFIGAFGEDAYRTLMTSVGDEAPLDESHFTARPGMR